jgi:hypothetical protein
MSNLPEGFQFSQGSLQDYVDCARRFRLRYLDQLAWPAVVAEPADEHEAQAADGAAFHRLVHQHQVGLSAARLSEMVEHARLSEAAAADAGSLPEWWRNYLEGGPQGLPVARRAEVALSAPLGGFRLTAQYDLVAIEPGGRAVIVDWKTSQRRTLGTALAGRMQTRVYRYLLARAGSALNGGLPIRPDQIEMIYWFASFPDEPERLRYDDALYQADEVLFARLVDAIQDEDPGGFPLTDEVSHCRFCTYRSLCNRGTRAGDIASAEDVEEVVGTASPAAFDFEHAAEIEF